MGTREYLLEKAKNEGITLGVKKAEKLLEEEREKAKAEKLKSALEFKKMGVPVADIAKGLELPVEEVKKLK